MSLLNIMCHNGVQRISHFVRNTGINHLQSLIMSLLIVVEDTLRNINELKHHFFHVFTIEGFHFNLDEVLRFFFMAKVENLILQISSLIVWNQILNTEVLFYFLGILIWYVCFTFEAIDGFENFEQIDFHRGVGIIF
jgi:hypothetical protein